MEESNFNLDLFYQINSYDDIQDNKLKKIKDNPYLLVESKNINPKIITFEFIEHLLINDGVDLSKIQEFRYLIEEEKNGKKNILLKPLSDNNLSEIKYLKQIYLHLIIEEETETPEFELLNDEIEEYNIKIEKYEKNFEEISNGIKKDEIYNNKVLSDNLFKNNEKNILDKPSNFTELNESKTFLKNGKKTPLKSYNSLSDINEDNIFNIDDNNYE